MKEKVKRTKIKLVISILLCVAILGFTGGTLAWFRYLQQLNTVALVQIPSKITLSGANRSELQRISLELTPDDTITGEGKVTIRRVFCVESTADFWLEVIRTTNIEGMDIKIYPVQTANSDLKLFIPESGMVKGNDGADVFYYIPNNAEQLNGGYLNQDGQIAIQKDETGTLHDENYVDGDTVQKNAEPLYWRTTAKEVFDRTEYSKEETAADGIKMCYRYYVLELSWDTTDQETDLVYLLASH